ncbi:MAG TPA: DNA-binding protein [Candidatus Nanoarchaeia archaeon]|nr:DNA-binding protein [Candidatus Nanoarchaeia archaeon]
MTNIKEYFENKEKLEVDLLFHITKGNLSKEEFAKNLVKAHIEKAKHNLDLTAILKDKPGFNDWIVIGLYYALYHASLALVANKGYISKNHTATWLFVIKNYSFNYEELRLIEELSITKSDAEFYTTLKKERHDASYSTDILFSNEKMNEFKSKTIDFLNKCEAILEK